MKAAMASGLTCVVVLAVCVFLTPGAFAGNRVCNSYRDAANTYHNSKNCYVGFCCGSCLNRYCCQDTFWRLSEEKQDECEDIYESSPDMVLISGIITSVTILLIFICCCVCPCCCLYKMCRKPRPVIATTTHTTVVTSTPQHYPQQPTAIAAHPQSYQGAPYPPYQPVPPQLAFGAQPMSQGYGAQPMSAAPYHGQPHAAVAPPTYQEAIGPCNPVNQMPYSQAAYNPSQPAYPPQPPVQSQAYAPMAHVDYLAQPAYNPDFVAPPPKTG